jgi:prepilin-type N-terminal cleavage/methylation domain-containing protein
MHIRKAGNKGFTLVEIMIVVALIGMLAGIAIPSFVHARSQSALNACVNNLRQIDDATQQWALENLQAPTATVTFDNIQPYLKSAIVCPSGGSSATFLNTYTLTTVSNKPICQIAPMSHILPPDSTS